MIGMFADVESHHMRPGNIHLSRFKYFAGCLLPFLDVHQRTDLMGSEGREYRLVFPVSMDRAEALCLPHAFLT